MMYDVIQALFFVKTLKIKNEVVQPQNRCYNPVRQLMGRIPSFGYEKGGMLMSGFEKIQIIIGLAMFLIAFLNLRNK